MLKFTQYWNFQRALGKINVFKNCISGIWGWSFFYHFHLLIFNIYLLIFWDSFSYKIFSDIKKLYLFLRRVFSYIGLYTSQWFCAIKGIWILQVLCVIKENFYFMLLLFMEILQLFWSIFETSATSAAPKIF